MHPSILASHLGGFFSPQASPSGTIYPMVGVPSMCPPPPINLWQHSTLHPHLRTHSEPSCTATFGHAHLSRPASCSRELQYGPCLVSGMGHETEFVIKGASSTCWLAHQSLWPTDYWRQCQSQVGAQVRDGWIQCVQCRGFGVRMETD